MLEVVNKTPVKDAFHFDRIRDGLHKAGRYILRFELTPALPSHPCQVAKLALEVLAGPATQIVLGVRPSHLVHCERAWKAPSVQCSAERAGPCRQVARQLQRSCKAAH